MGLMALAVTLEFLGSADSVEAVYQATLASLVQVCQAILALVVNQFKVILESADTPVYQAIRAFQAVGCLATPVSVAFQAVGCQVGQEYQASPAIQE